MLMPSTITARRTRRYTSTWYIRRTIHRLNFKPMDDGRRYSIQSPIVSNSSAHVDHFNSAAYIFTFTFDVVMLVELDGVYCIRWGESHSA